MHIWFILMMFFSFTQEALALTPTPYTYDPDRPARDFSEPYAGPIVDTHVHFLRGLKGMGPKKILNQLREARVERMIVLPTPNEGRMNHRKANAEVRRDWIETARAMAGRLCGSTDFTYWMEEVYQEGFDPDDLQARLERLSRDLTEGGCMGVGEIGPYHFDKQKGMAVLRIPLDFEPMLQLVDLAAERDIWLDAHLEPRTPHGQDFEQEIFDGIAQWFERQPRLKLILSHTGMTTAQNARNLLETYPGLMMNMKMVNPKRRIAWDHLGRISDRQDRFFEDWARLFESHPDRFMIGTDYRFGDKRFKDMSYLVTIDEMRHALGSLDPQAAAMIAYGNAVRVFGEQ